MSKLKAKIKIASEFTDTPGPRFIGDGPFSGEEFRKRFLEPLFENNNDLIEIDFDDAWGYPSSFLEEAFGGLARKYGKDKVLNRIEIISNDEPTLEKEIQEYIEKSSK